MVFRTMLVGIFQRFLVLGVEVPQTALASVHRMWKGDIQSMPSECHFVNRHQHPFNHTYILCRLRILAQTMHHLGESSMLACNFCYLFL